LGEKMLLVLNQSLDTQERPLGGGRLTVKHVRVGKWGEPGAMPLLVKNSGR